LAVKKTRDEGRREKRTGDSLPHSMPLFENLARIVTAYSNTFKFIRMRKRKEERGKEMIQRKRPRVARF